MAIFVNTDEQLTHEEVARKLAVMRLESLATHVRRLGEQAADMASRYHALLSEYGRVVSQLRGPQPMAEPPVSYKRGPMSDG